MDTNFSQRVKDVISFSREEALRLGHDYIGTEHFLLGMIREGDGVAIKILNNLNVDLVEKKILIGSVKLEVIDLCRPCRHLSEKLGRYDIIKEFLRKGGIRCQILNDGKISLSDQIKII